MTFYRTTEAQAEHFMQDSLLRDLNEPHRLPGEWVGIGWDGTVFEASRGFDGQVRFMVDNQPVSYDDAIDAMRVAGAY